MAAQTDPFLAAMSAVRIRQTYRPARSISAFDGKPDMRKRPDYRRFIPPHPRRDPCHDAQNPESGSPCAFSASPFQRPFCAA